MQKTIEFNVSVSGKVVFKGSNITNMQEYMSFLKGRSTVGLAAAWADHFSSLPDMRHLYALHRIANGPDALERAFRYMVRTHVREIFGDVELGWGYDPDTSATLSRPNVRLTDDRPPVRRAKAEALNKADAEAILAKQ